MSTEDTRSQDASQPDPVQESPSQGQEQTTTSSSLETAPTEASSHDAPSPETRPVQEDPPAVETASEVTAASSDEATPADVPSASPPVAADAAPESGASASAPSESASTESAADQPGEDASRPKRKLELKPTFDPDAARPVATFGPGSGPSADAAPVEIPSASDEDIEAEIAKAVSGVTSSDIEETQPAADGERVEIPGKDAVDVDVDAMIQAAMSSDSSAEASDSGAVADPDELKRGDKLAGTIQSHHDDLVFVDVGLRMTAAVPFRQFDAKKPPVAGESLEILFDRIDEAEGLILGNLPRGTAQVKGGNWDAVIPDQIVECSVSKTNKGGLEVTVGSLRGFMPASQVELGYVADLEQYVGQKLRARVMEVKPSKRRLVVSRRAVLAEEREVQKAGLLEELKPDQIRTGRVKTIKDYGAFIDLGGMDGFLPIAQISWVRIEHPSEVISEGQEIEVKVLSVDREKDRISLSMRQLAPNPWKQAEEKYNKGSNVTGRVTRVEAFGAFVELEPGIEGLVHISELDHRRVKRVTEVLNVGDMAEVQVLEVDPKKKRISLSVKALKAKPEPVEQPKDEDLAPGKGQAYERKRKSPLKGGTGSPQRGGLFGNPRDFS